MIDGVLQFDFPGPGASTGLAEPSSPFVVGPENRLLAAPVERLLGAPTALAPPLCNPLVLVGPAGSGKSHLVQGLVRAVSQRVGAQQAAYFTAADFGRERQAAEAEQRLDAWRDQVRGVRLLVVEDLDRLRPRATIQRELRATIDAVTLGGGNVVVTAHCEPMLISHLEPGLRDRLTAGLTIRINRPDLPARRALLAQFAAARGLDLASDRLDCLAQKECGAAGQLLGRLALAEQSLTRQSSATHGPATHGAASHGPSGVPGGPADSAGSSLPTHQGAAPVKHILAVTARYFGLSQSALTGPSRRRSLVQARNMVVYLARRHTDLSYADIGRALGNRDHTTIMHADRRLADQLASDAETEQTLANLDRIISS
ncbi:MAG TPA: DnaA/Hda family protein [Lacipirellulaceae bacterium]|nr:DnaA/Hda family protein [Lacipirellulaceae bacterium]